MKIESLTNPRIKELVKLKQGRSRRTSQLTVIEGAAELARAVEAGVALKAVYVCRDFFDDAEGLLRKLPAKLIADVSRSVYEKIAFGERKDGIVAVGQPKVVTLKQVKFSSPLLVAVVEHVEKPGNLGAILRSCDGAGVQAVLVCDPATDIFNPHVIRSSLGTVFSLAVVSCTNEEALSFLKSRKVKIVAATPQGARRYSDCDLTGNAAVVFGSEQKGLSEFWLNAADERVSLPMKGKADSLNVSATAAVLLYEILRQRNT